MKRPIRVLHVASGDLWAGAEVMLWQLVSAQARSTNVLPAVALLNDHLLAERFRSLGISLSILDEQRLTSAHILQSLNKLMKTLAPDVVHTHRYKENILAGLAAGLQGIPSLRTMHGAEEHRASFRQIARWSTLKADDVVARTLQARVVAVCAALARNLPAKLSRKVSVIHNGIDAEALGNGAARAGSENPVRIGFVGRLTAVKRVDRFLRVARALSDELPGRFEFVVAGDGPLLEPTRRLATELGLAAETRVQGFVDDIPNLLRTLTALYVTSDSEGIPYSILEAHALNVPVVATAVGGLPEVLEDGAAGILVDPNEESGFVAAGIRLARDFSSFKPMLRRAQMLVRSEFSQQTMAANYAALYDTIAATPRK